MRTESQSRRIATDILRSHTGQRSYDYLVPLVIIMLFLFVSGCYPNEGAMYTFKRLDDHNIQHNTSRIGLPDLSRAIRESALKDNGYGLFAAKFRGSLLALFGEPNHTSSDSSSAYEYYVEATDGDGQSWVLTVYEGPSGPAIGGRSQDATNQSAAEVLLRLILDTSPADYDAIIYDSDTRFTVSYGCYNGNCYYRQRQGRHLP